MNDEKVDITEFSKTITGFDEIAIRKAFGSPFEDLPGMTATRSLLFVRERRNGANDKDAYKTVMEMTVGEIIDLLPERDSEGNGQSPERTTD